MEELAKLVEAYVSIIRLENWRFFINNVYLLFPGVSEEKLKATRNCASVGRKGKYFNFVHWRVFIYLFYFSGVTLTHEDRRTAT